MTAHPEELHSFLAATDWADADIAPLPGDASFRRYFRLKGINGSSAILMHAPPPHEDSRPFLAVAHWLENGGLRAPHIIAEDTDGGWVLLEDFGNWHVREWLDTHPGDEGRLYEAAVDTLVQLHRLPPGPFDSYDLAEYQREAGLFIEWYCPGAGLAVDERGWRDAWNVVLAPVLARQKPGVVVLKDYHAENIMLPPDGSQGLIDFQDALIGHPAYDLVSLLQDARRDVSPALEQAMLMRYMAATGHPEEFEADYARLGAQRNTKIVGVFTRLAKRDGKARYLELIPRVLSLLERDLAHPALKPVADWFDENIPAAVRSPAGARIG
jgi:aminoglycoside/choline kinase family phosphotransferase